MVKAYIHDRRIYCSFQKNVQLLKVMTEAFFLLQAGGTGLTEENINYLCFAGEKVFSASFEG